MFVKDDRAANLLTAFGVQWKYSNDVNIDDLYPDWEKDNAGRRLATNDEAVLEYAARMENKENAPAVILRKTSRDYEVLDGIQRIKAAVLNKATRISAYVVTTDSDALADQVRVLANRKLSGYREDPQWELRQAIQILIGKHGMSVEETSRLLGMKKERVEEEKTFLDWSFEIRRIGGPHDMKKGVVHQVAEHAKLHDLHSASKPIAEFLHDLNKAKFTNGESEPVIKEFFGDIVRKGKNSTFEQYTEKLERFRDDPEVKTRLEGRPRDKRSPEILLRQAMKNCLTVAKKVAKAKSDITYVDEYYQLWNQVHRELKRMDKHAHVEV
jgi:ParB-like chromosome segregation protein Spo0J